MADLATPFIATNHDGALPEKLGDRSDGVCCFCSTHGSGFDVTDVINPKYFNDDDLMAANTGHVCESCAYCMTADRSLKMGHWIATPDTYQRVPTADLRTLFVDLANGQYDPPIAVYVAKRANISQHAYLWTPVSERIDPLRMVYARQPLYVDYDGLFGLVDAIEDLRFHGSRLDEIRTAEPRVGVVESLGIGTYRGLREAVEPHRGTPLLELALTLSRSPDDQDRDETTGGNTTLTNYA